MVEGAVGWRSRRRLVKTLIATLGEEARSSHGDGSMRWRLSWTKFEAERSCATAAKSTSVAFQALVG
eukprot:CAMPEP_0198670350 /NCGR_PEP_ID=MMETSP1467-20131203/80502_1 /TAXON_ID=1462469 /ORGANISM="unid. sp., Strain CCMP2135" /LENGTH=66 /DNA_ID=CAMNT_0044407129 /DNA_START=62 /DNA_END=259 /DNA_ORIENTATION=+